MLVKDHLNFLFNSLKKEWKPLLFLFVCATYYCHRFYGIYIPFEGNTLNQVYYRAFEYLLKIDHNPYQWNYMSLMGDTGLYNPLLRISSFLFSFTKIPTAFKALLICMMTSWLSLLGLCFSWYLFFRKIGHQQFGSLFSTIVVSFSGFHLIGIREFTHMYLLSFLFVPLLLLFFSRWFEDKKDPLATLGVAVCIGISLLGGSGEPLIYFWVGSVIFFFIYLSWKREFTRMPGQFARVVLATSSGMGLAAISIYPKFSSLSLSPPSTLSNLADQVGIGFSEKLLTIFLRDWWRMGGQALYEQDYFCGILVILFAGWGLWTCFTQTPFKNQNTWLLLFSFLFVMGFLGTSIGDLPDFLKQPLSSISIKLSFTHFDRFFIICLVALAYWAGIGFDKFSMAARWYTAHVGLLFLVGAGLYAGPAIRELFPETGLSIKLYLLISTIGFGILALSLYQKRPLTRTQNWSLLSILFLSFTWTSIQSTQYEKRYIQAKRAPAQSRQVEVDNFLGLGWKYPNLRRQVASYFEAPPSYLDDPTTHRGRILDISPSVLNEQKAHHAPYTRHRFAFTGLSGKTHSKHLKDLYEIRTPAIKNMYGICQEVIYNKKGPELKDRPECFSLAYFVDNPLFLKNERHVLEWMKKASNSDFKNSVALNCEQVPCFPINQKLTRSHKFENPNEKNLKTSLSKIKILPGKIFIEGVVKRSGILVVTELFKKDWMVQVNGMRGHVFRVNHAFAGVLVPAGPIKVVLQKSQIIPKEAKKFSMVSFLILSSLIAFHLRKSFKA